MSRRPLIGITAYARDRGAIPSFNMPCGYIDCVRAADGSPVVLPPGEKDAANLLKHLDGLILAGGGDIAPSAYGGEHHETIYSVCEERDEFEFALARAVVQRPQMPLLCICRGMQLLNVVDGGTLHSHVPDRFGDEVPHRLPPKLTSRHAVRIEPSSRLAALLGVTETKVCSWHHQALDRIGAHLQAVAWAADGVIEAVEHRVHPWCFGVQWHPEMQPEDDVQHRLFAALVGAARDKK